MKENFTFFLISQGHLHGQPAGEDPLRDADDRPAAVHRHRGPVRGRPRRLRHQEVELKGAQQRSLEGNVPAAGIPEGRDGKW